MLPRQKASEYKTLKKHIKGPKMRTIKQLQLAVNKVGIYRTAKKVQKPQQKYYFEQKEMWSPYEKQPCQEKTVKKLKRSLQLQPKIFLSGTRKTSRNL